jgi:SagB-type dehydrogenase family enzyme
VNWREYHQSTKHTVQSLDRTPHLLDWENMPDPFRHYEDTPVLDLPADPPAPEIPALDVLHGASGVTPAADGPAFLSQLMFHTAAISASKRVPSTGYRYALRVNPSSGNLHPTEFHFFTQFARCAQFRAQWPDGLYHYRPSSHMAEQRAAGNPPVPAAGSGAPLVFVLSSIAWREAWKYGDRAYRYCLLDMGHAWQSLALAAGSMGCGTFSIGHFPDDEVAGSCRLHGDEWPMLIVKVSGGAGPCPASFSAPATNENTTWSEGSANELSPQQVDFPMIDAIHSATKLAGNPPGLGTLDLDSLSGHHQAPPVTVRIAGGEPVGSVLPLGSSEITLPSPASSTRAFGEVARARRSALDFRGGSRSISLAQLSAILAVTAEPLDADFANTRFISLYLYVHRVDGLDPGVYRYWPEHASLRQAGLELIRPGDQRVAAAGLSLGQDLAGNACVAFSMIADLDRAARAHGDRGYRYAHFEAGAIGHRLYLAAEALGLGATGIGAFFDDQVHDYLRLAPAQGQVVYHFAIGYPVDDPRLAG